MANSLGDMVVRIVGDNSDLDKSIDNSQAKLKAFGISAQRVGIGLTAGITTPLVALATASFKSSAEMENLTTSFQIMLGSADKAQKLIADVVQMAAVTPFTSPQLADATKMLLQYGVSVEEVLPLISRLGDISAGNGDKFNRLSYAFSQMSALGRVTGQDLRQMVEAGFNPLKVISDKTGESMASLQDRMSKGKLGIDEMKKALVIATSEGGKFFKGMEFGSKTFTGLVSTLQDNLGIAGRSITDAFLPILKDAVIKLSDLALKFSQLDPPVKTFIVTLTGLAAIAGPVALGIGSISKAFVALKTTNPEILIITASIVALGVGLATLASISKDAADKTNNLTDALSGQADLIRSNKALDDTIDKINKLKAAMAVEGFSSRGNAEQRKQLELLEAQRDTIQSNIDTLNRQREAQKNANATTDNAAKKVAEATAWEQDRTKATEDYEEKIRKINLEVHEGLKTEEEGRKARKDALEGYIDDLNTIIAKYSLVEGVTTQLVDKQIALFNAMKNGNETLKTRAQILGEYSTADQMVTDIVIADLEREKEAARQRLIERAKAEQQFYKFREEQANNSAKEISLKDIQAIMDTASQYISIWNNAANKEITIINKNLEKKIALLNKEKDAKLKAAGIQEKTALEQAKIELQAAQDAYDGKKSLIDAELDALDEKEQALLYSLGLVEAATLEQYDVEIAAALAAGDYETALSLEKSRAKLAIELDFQGQKKKIEDEEKIRIAKQELEKQQIMQDTLDAISKATEEANKNTATLQQTMIDTSKGPFLGFIDKLGEGLKNIDWSDATKGLGALIDSIKQALPQLLFMAGVEVAKVNPTAGLALIAASGLVEISNLTETGQGQSGRMVPITGTFADKWNSVADDIEKNVAAFLSFDWLKGHATGTNFAIGGLTKLAERGAELVVNPSVVNLPAGSRVFNAADTRDMLSSSDTSEPLYLTVQLDSATLYSGIFDATKNRTIQISAGAVV